MSLTIELSPAIQARLEEEAARQGLDVEGLTRSVIEKHLSAQDVTINDQRPFHERASVEEWKREFRAWVNSHEGLKSIPLSSEALRHEYMYEDREK